MSMTIEVPDNVPVSWLQRVTHLSDDLLLLASEPNHDTETEFMSRYFTYYDMHNDLSARFKLESIWDHISDLYDGKISLSDYLDNTICCNINDPYIISSLRQGPMTNGTETSVGILSASGYYLSTGMKTVFDNALDSTGHLSTIIPSLSSKTTNVVNPTVNFISSITDWDGHVQSYGYGNFQNVVETYGSKLMVKNNPAGDSRLLHVQQPKIYVLNYSEFNDMRSRSQLEKNVIYMTVNDPDDVE